jgi:hypothetical protein
MNPAFSAPAVGFSLKRMYPVLGFALVLIVLLPFYLSTLQTIPNGSEHYYMIDVGEAQSVLNTWGTLHATGYPLHVILGNVLVAIMRGLGISPVAAPAIVALIWGLTALALIYALALHLTGRILASAAVTILFGLTRTVWIHHVIAEVYTFGLAILALLLLIALWKKDIPHRIYWLAFVGGIGVFHHRALIMAAPALIYAVWPQLTAQVRRIPRIVCISLVIGLIGFLPYLYLPIRANAGAQWVYGEPNSWVGFWDQFLGREANRFIGPPGTLAALAANFNRINTVLVTDLTWPGIVLGIVGLILGIRSRKYRRTALTLLISAGVAYVFHVLWYDDILSALILPIILTFAFGWLFLLDCLLDMTHKRGYGLVLLLSALFFGAALALQNNDFIRKLTTDRTGLDTIALAHTVPSGSTLMLDWGPRYFAVAFDKNVLGNLSGIRLATHKADFKAIVASGELVTPDYTFFNRPLSWWENQIGQRVYVRAAGAHLVQISTEGEYAQNSPSQISPLKSLIECTPDSINLSVAWSVHDKPTQDESVFVHLLDSDGKLIAQGDVFAPVYGLRPLTGWDAKEIVRDVYSLPRLHNGATIHYGLYHQLPDGTFANTVEYGILVRCDG